MITAMTRSLRIAAAGVVLGSLAACGGDGSNASGGSDNTPRYGSEEFGLTLDELAARIEEVEGLIGECMTAAGFDYVPVDFEQVKEGMDADQTAPGLSDEEYVAQYGFGVTTQFNWPGREIGLGERNIAIYEGLTADQKVAYDHTLFGENREWTFAKALEFEDFSQTGGCTREAVEQSFAAEELNANYLNPGDAVIEQDERMVDAIAQWSDCVGQEGYDYAHPDDIDKDLEERLMAITEGADPASLTGTAAEALAELQGEELALAAVAIPCEEDIIDPVEEEIETEIYGAPQE